jgi:manganese/iron transport system substrate-binding protein
MVSIVNGLHLATARLTATSRCAKGRAAGSALVLALVGCAQSPLPNSEPVSAPTEDRPAIVATNTVLCDLTEQIAGDSVALTCLLDYGQDPHVYKPSPSDRAAIDDADLILYGGYQFESSIIGLVEATSNPAPKVAVYEEAVPEPIMAAGHDHADHADHTDHADHSEGEHADHAESEAHSDGEAEAQQPDPHVWQNATNSGAIAAVLATHLGAAVPDQAAQYSQKAAALQAQFAQLDGWIQAQAETVPTANRTLVTTHDAFRYFATAYGFEVGGVLSGLSTAEKPSASALSELVEQIKAAQVPAIFAEATTNPKLIEAVAKDAGVGVADSTLYDAGPGGPNTEAATVQAMLAVNTCTIVNALGGSCDLGTAPL